MLAGAVVPALAETAALEAGMSVRLGFSEEPEVAAGGPLPETLWEGAQAAVGAVGAAGAVGEEGDPGARGVGAFRSGRSAVLRLRPVLRRVWSGVPPVSSGAEAPRDAMRAEACPLAVVGGLGGVGVLVGRWGSAARPAAAGSAVLLVGRRGRVGGDVRPAMRWYEQWDGVACLARGDAGLAEDGAVWAQRAVRGMSGPVSGVVHTAGVLGDGTLGVQDVARLRVTSGCKAEAWSLRGAAASLQAQALHFAALFSSVAALSGSVGQASYSAANAGLDLLGRAWQAAGAPCTSVQWGVWGAVGMASRGAAAARMERLGIDLGTMAPGVGLAALERVAVRRAREEAAVVCATRGAYWDALVAAAGSSRGVPELFRELVRGPPAAAAKAVPGRSDEAPRALQASAVQAQLRGLAGSLLGKDVAVDAPLMEQGLDSLGVVELRNAVGRELGLHLSPTAVLDYPTVAALAGHVMAELAGAARRPRRAAQADVATVLSAAAQLPAPAGGASAAHQDAVSCIPWGRWDADELDRLMQLLEGGRTLQEPSLRMAAMLPAVGMFDGAAFGTSSAEAVLMDPQQRVLLQVAWEALQGASGAAGLTEAALEGAGAYVGVQQ